MEIRERLDLLRKAEDNPRLQSILYEKCRRDIVFWFNTFCWTVDPRVTDRRNTMPFVLWPVQEWLVQELQAAILEPVHWGIEKSRDMGASWIVMLVFQHFWLFRPGSQFLCGSYKEKEICTADQNSSTLFGKFRINLYRQPWWLRPGPRQIKDKKLSVMNTANGSSIEGTAPTPSFGRGQRKTAILLDELAFWQYQELVYGPSTRISDSVGVVSTPFGLRNKYGELMNDSRNEVRHYPDLKAEMERKGLIHGGQAAS